MTDLKSDLIHRLEAIPGIDHEPWPDRADGFSVIRFRGKEIGHFHTFHELDLRLGKKRIQQEGLVHPPGSTVHPKRAASSPFIELRFYEAGDLDRIVALVRRLVEDLS